MIKNVFQHASEWIVVLARVLRLFMYSFLLSGSREVLLEQEKVRI